MSLKVENTKIEGVKVITPLHKFEDHRGTYLEIFDQKRFFEATGQEIKFVQDDVSISRKNVLRGLHGDWKTTKLVTVLKGAGYAVLVDNRPESPTYRKWQAFLLNDETNKQLLIPPGIGNSVLALEDKIVYFYKQDTHFEDGHQFTLRWDDPELNIWWCIKNPILSERDAAGRYVK